MSAENLNTPEAKPKGGNTGRIISIIVGALLVGAVSFFAYRWNEAEKSIQAFEVNEENLTAEIVDLEENLDDFKLQLDDQALDLEDKERMLQEKELLIIEKEKRIDDLVRKNRLSQKQADELRAKVKSLNYYITRYEEQIDELKSRVALLEGEKAELESKVNNMSGKVQELKSENEAKDFKLDVAKVLGTNSFGSYYIRSNGKKIASNPIRRRRMDHFEICFNIVQNTAADKGERDVYLQVRNPAGEVIRDNGSQSGYHPLESAGGGDQPYTSKTKIDFDGTNTSVCIDFQTPEDLDLEKGIYDVMVYADGYNIGSSSFEVN